MSFWSTLSDGLAAAGRSLAQYFADVDAGPAGEPEMSVAFAIGLIALAAKMAKADGVVTAEEVAAFRQILDIRADEASGVARVFNLARHDVAGFESYARQLARLFARKRIILEDVLDGLFHIAKADGGIHAREHAYLEAVAAIFGFDAAGFARIRARHVATAGEEPYAVLGLGPAASDDEARRRYRALVRAHHPDRHIAAGMPPEAVRIATERLARINAAYDAIARERGL